MKPHPQAQDSGLVSFGGEAMKKTPLVALALMFAFLTACSPGSSSRDALEELATLADSNGDIEATLEIASVGSSQLTASLGDTGTHEIGHILFRGKPLHGLITAVDIPSLWTQGARIQVRGKLESAKGVPVFVGVAQASSGGQADVGGIVLLSANKTLPNTTPQSQQVRAQVVFQDVLISGYTIVQPRPELEEIVLFKSTTGMLGLGRPTQPTGLPKGNAGSGSTASCEGSVDRSIIGPVGNASCVWKGPNFGTDKNIIGILIAL